MMFSKDMIIGKLVSQGFIFISNGKDGILLKRKSTGKKICILFTDKLCDRWMSKGIHPFRPVVKNCDVYFEDLLNGDILKNI